MPTDVVGISWEHVETFLAWLLATKSPATAETRHKALRRFFGWLVAEGELDHSPLERVKPPRVPARPPAVLTEDQLRRLIKACEGTEFVDRRDMAIIRLLIDTGLRRGELAGLTVGDIDLDANVAVVLGKECRPRACPFGRKTAVALDRYLRARLHHPQAHQPGLWLGQRGALRHDAVYCIVQNRADAAGIGTIHPHLFRHTFAHAWLAAGGQEGELMRLAGWRSRTMLGRYGASAADERARDAYRHFAPGDRL
jgi:integrase